MSLASLYIGIDISKAHLDVFTHETGDFTRYRNTSAGIGELLAVLDDSVALIVLESTARHEKLVMRALQQAGLPVACVHARMIRAHIAADTAMARRMEILRSCKGVGPVTAARRSHGRYAGVGHNQQPQGQGP